MSSPVLNPLVDKIRSMHPGAYDDMDDATLTKAVLAKYPQYSDLAAPKIQKPSAPEMQPSFMAQALGSGNTERSAVANPQQPAEQFALENPEQQPTLAAASAVGAAGSLPQALPFLSKALTAAKPYVIPALASLGISKAKELPFIGPVVQKIPYAEMLPWLFNPTKEAPPEPLQEGAHLPANPYEQVQAAQQKRQFIKNQQAAMSRAAQMENDIYPGAPFPEAPANVPVKTKIGGRYVLTPEEAQQSEQIQQIAKKRASERGMQYAAGMKPSGGKVPTP